MGTELNAEVRAHSEVTGIDSDERQITLADGSQLAYGRLVIACGADPIRLTFEGDGANAVQSVNDLDDYSRFYASLESSKSVAIIGAGLIGCELPMIWQAARSRSALLIPRHGHFPAYCRKPLDNNLRLVCKLKVLSFISARR